MSEMQKVNMARRRNAAFAGMQTTLDGLKAFNVYYLGGKELKTIRDKRKEAGLRNLPRGHQHALRVGWYWIRIADMEKLRPGRRVGPFTSSRGAYEDACNTLGRGVAP